MFANRRKSTLLFLLVWMLAVLAFPGMVGAQDGDATEEPASDYVIPADPENIDLGLVVATVGDQTITLGQFRDRLRYERYLYYRVLNNFVNQVGEQVLMLDDPGNPYAQPLQQFLISLANEQLFGQQVYRSMVLERLYHNEAVARGLELNECTIISNWSQLLELTAPEDCTYPEGFEEAQADFFRIAATYSNLSEAEIEAALTAAAEFEALRASLGAELDVPDVEIIRTRHIRVTDQDVANDVARRLRDGESFHPLLEEFTQDSGAVGNGGTLPAFGRGRMVAEFEQAAFDAQVGEIVGPVQSQFGFHIIEVLSQEAGVRVSHILLETEAEAQTAVRLIRDDGVDIGELARTYSRDFTTRNAGGDLGYLTPGSSTMPAEFNEAVFSAQQGDVLGPIQTVRGFHVARVTEVGTEISEVRARHILVATEDEAQAVLDRLEAGEDFAALANELSIDPSAGHHGDTLSVITNGQERGAYTFQEMFEQVPGLAVALRDAQVGDVVGPVQTEFGFFVLEVQERGFRPPSAEERQAAEQTYIDEWQRERLDGDDIVTTDLWRNFIPGDPMPSDVAPVLDVVDLFIITATQRAEQQRINTSIFNLLSTLRLPVVPPPADDTEDGD